jgi:hypothetical protein
VTTQITAPTTRNRPVPRIGLVEVAFLAVIVAALVGVGVWSQAASDRQAIVDTQAYGAGYPLHGGLAGPSRVGQVSNVVTADHHGQGYPLHGGLAGPARVPTAIDIADHHGQGYPLHGGLAGPSRADRAD